MTNEQYPASPHHVAIGCYGSRRGSTIAALVRANLEHKYGEGYQHLLQIHGTGHANFKKEDKIEPKHIAALRKAVANAPHLQGALDDIAKTGRQYLPNQELGKLDELYAVDTYIGQEYQKAGARNVTTVLQAARMPHGMWGIDLDDTETSHHYTTEVIVPKLQKKPISPNAPKTKEEADWYALNGQKYRAGTEEARDIEATDLVEIAYNLAENIGSKYIDPHLRQKTA